MPLDVRSGDFKTFKKFRVIRLYSDVRAERQQVIVQRAFDFIEQAVEFAI
ncbi:MAG: hypothetical protein WA584_23280 [Pyrinomonadaceae bacterium]